jgi:hypothetical protein
LSLAFLAWVWVAKYAPALPAELSQFPFFSSASSS